ncbi:MAG: preprotein translocase subunit SecY [Clostridia bacterium]|nr:preprotein translocase subunit SecY [Clostridia bacterium]MBO7297108.1 preprotein translocase subunit SecY [Clostridia bacterium]
MFQTLKNAWKIPELKNKLLFTLLIVLLYRIGASIPLPWVSSEIYTAFQSMSAGDMFQYLNLLSGDAFSRATLFALSVSPYITASIVMQLLTIAIPALERMAKDGENGKKKITAITRVVTVALALITAYGYTMYLENMFSSYITYASQKGAALWFCRITLILCYCAGASLIMWLAEKINEKGIGNGISIILFANIVSRVPTYLTSTIPNIAKAITKGIEQEVVAIILNVVIYIAVVAVILAAFGFVVWFTGSERRIPIQYAKRVVGRKMYGGQSSSLPLKLNMSGVMPIIFANSIVALPATIAAFFTNVKKDSWLYFAKDFFDQMTDVLSYTSPLYLIIFIALIIAFSYFYIMISFNPVEVANNIRNNGGSVPGIRPGKPTIDYIKKILNRVTLIGGLFLCVISGLPLLVMVVLNLIPSLTSVVASMSELAFSGSSLLIVVGVALETVRELEAQITLRNYKGFLD